MPRPSQAELVSFVVSLERDGSQESALDAGWNLFQAAHAAGLVEANEIEAFAVSVGEAVEAGLLSYRSRGARRPALPAGAQWTSAILQEHYGYHSTAAGRADAALSDRERPADAGPEEGPDRAKLTQAFERLNNLFQLPAGMDFPFLPAPVGPEQARLLSRYVRTTRELADSSILTTSGYGYKVSWTETNSTVEADLPGDESLRGVSVLFRQLYSPEEPASFNRALGIIRGQAGACTDDERTVRIDFLTRWGRAHGQLRAKWMETLALELGREEGWVPQELGTPNAHLTPEQVLSVFFYGDLVHWDRGAEQVEEWSRDPWSSAHHRLLFLRAITQLSALYIGFAPLVVTALPFNQLHES